MSEHPAAWHAHAVLHCNLNTGSVADAETFYVGRGLTRRMWNETDDTDATSMGLGVSTASFTSFLYDARGPRSAPALELVEWRRPATADRDAPANATTGLRAVGIRVPRLDAADSSSPVQGVERALRADRDTDGVDVELVALPGAEETPCLAYLRLAVADLEATRAWYSDIGFVDVADSPDRLSLVLPADPTFSLEIEEDPDAPRSSAAANTRGLYRIALAVEDVVAAHAALRDARRSIPEPVHIPMPDTPTGGFTVLFLRDPDGVVIELVDRPRSSVRRPLTPTGLRTAALGESA